MKTYYTLYYSKRNIRVMQTDSDLESLNGIDLPAWWQFDFKLWVMDEFETT